MNVSPSNKKFKRCDVEIKSTQGKAFDKHKVCGSHLVVERENTVYVLATPLIKELILNPLSAEN